MSFDICFTTGDDDVVTLIEEFIDSLTSKGYAVSRINPQDLIITRDTAIRLYTQRTDKATKVTQKLADLLRELEEREKKKEEATIRHSRRNSTKTTA